LLPAIYFGPKLVYRTNELAFIRASYIDDFAPIRRKPFITHIISFSMMNVECETSGVLGPWFERRNLTGTASARNEFTIDTEKRHQELLELISSESGLIKGIMHLQ
jgi:hypothetical protein